MRFYAGKFAQLRWYCYRAGMPDFPRRRTNQSLAGAGFQTVRKLWFFETRILPDRYYPLPEGRFIEYVSIDLGIDLADISRKPFPQARKSRSTG